METTQARKILKEDLSVSLALLLPVFPVLYILAALKLIDPDTMFILCTVMDVVTKGLFTQTALDCQLTVLSSLQVEMRAVTAAAQRRHVFLKFLLHEVSITRHG